MDEKDENISGWAWPNGPVGPPHRTMEAAGGWDWPHWQRGQRGKLFGNAIAAFFVLFLVEPLSEVFGHPYGAPQRIGVVAVVAVIGLGYLLAVTKGPAMPHVGRVLNIAVLAIMPVLLSLILGTGSLLFWTFAVSPALLILPRLVGAILGLACAAGVVVVTEVVNRTADWNSAMVLVTLTVAMFAFSALVRTVGELRNTQDKMARLAVAEERSRLARDLHDVLGHSLTTITVKAGLARRVLESEASLERAISEVRDVEELARQAMADVRATVSGYRTASLPTELAGARAALSAAGIEADLPQAVDGVSPALRETFAYVLREGVTNVIRHSGASRCEVRLGDTWVEVRDDGRAAAGAVCASRDNGGGHGLSGLAERVGAVQGTLSAAPLPDGGFLLRAQVTGADETARGSASSKNLVGRPSIGLT